MFYTYRSSNKKSGSKKIYLIILLAILVIWIIVAINGGVSSTPKVVTENIPIVNNK
ncbi:hypothetical protein ACFX5K_05545 [Rickettsiales bacterium LUAb2]